MEIVVEMSKVEIRILQELEKATGFDKDFIISSLLLEVYSGYKCAKKAKRIDEMPAVIWSKKLLKDIAGGRG